MNNISQISIFEYREIENLGDLERLKIFFENIDDDKLCEKLEKRRKNGRNDYPVRTMLNLIYAMKIFGHRSVESFRRELSRNSQLRIACGLSEGKYKYLRERKHLIPPARVFTGFLNKLKDCKTEIEEIFILSIHHFLFNARSPCVSIRPCHLIGFQIKHHPFIFPVLQIIRREDTEIPSAPSGLSVGGGIDIIFFSLMRIQYLRVSMETLQHGIVGNRHIAHFL